jgi:propanediol dehydratase small subunit
VRGDETWALRAQVSGECVKGFTFADVFIDDIRLTVDDARIVARELLMAADVASDAREWLAKDGKTDLKIKREVNRWLNKLIII